MDTDTLAEADLAALAAVLERAEAGDGTVTYADVADDVPPERWGRLLEEGALVAAGDRFVVADPTAVREAVAARGVDASEAADDADGGWRPVDRAAGVASLGLMASYQYAPARDAVGQPMHALLGPVEAALPFGATVAVLAVVAALVSTAVQRRLRDTDRMERVKARMDRLRDDLERARERGDREAVERLEARQREMAGEQLSAMTALLRPMAWTVLFTAPVFLWLTWLTVSPSAAVTPTATVFPMFGHLVWTARVLGPVQAWTAWYIGCSLVSSLTATRVAKRLPDGVASA